VMLSRTARSNKTVGLHYIRFQKTALGTSITCMLAAAQNCRNRGRRDELGLTPVCAKSVLHEFTVNNNICPSRGVSHLSLDDLTEPILNPDLGGCIAFGGKSVSRPESRPPESRPSNVARPVSRGQHLSPYPSGFHSAWSGRQEVGPARQRLE
jgi:hypothetical protein